MVWFWCGLVKHAGELNSALSAQRSAPSPCDNPPARPIKLTTPFRPDLSAAAGLHELSTDELRALSRQHAFAGYSRPEYLTGGVGTGGQGEGGSGVCGGTDDGRESAAEGGGRVVADPLVICRHHAIDWNYHPNFPRSRPNKWRVEMGPQGESFKEWGWALDEHGQSIYFERWQRLPNDGGTYITHAGASGGTAGDAGAGGQFVAMRRLPPQSPTSAQSPANTTAASLDSFDDRFLVVVGDHFALARGRPHDPPQRPPPGFPRREDLTSNLHPIRAHPLARTRVFVVQLPPPHYCYFDALKNRRHTAHPFFSNGQGWWLCEPRRRCLGEW